MDYRTGSDQHTMSEEVFQTHSFHEASVQLIFSKDVQVEVPDAKKDGRLDHGERLFQPVSAGHHSKVHWRVGPALARGLPLTLLPHDVPAQQHRCWNVKLVNSTETILQIVIYQDHKSTTL